MYNPYLSQQEYESPPQPEPMEAGKQQTTQVPTPQGGFSWRDWMGGEGKGQLMGLLKALKLEKLDSGDILLILIILLLLLEGDDHWEMVITLGLLLIMGLVDTEKED